jgi:hypothetical protein
MTTQQAPQNTYRTALDDIEIGADVESAIAQMQASGKDTGSLTAQQRAGYVTALCRALRLNPLTSPVQFIRLNGKEVLYVTRTATDQLAAIHGLNRKTVRGPEIVDIAGTKIAICAVEVTLPNGRSETATATLPVSDPAMLYMKLETKAKRRGTLAILGLGLLAEEEAESISGAERVDLAPAPKRPALDVFRDAIDRDGTLAAIVVTWHAHCAALAAEKAADDAAADVAKWLAEGGYVLSKTEQQALLARNFTPGMLSLLDALAMQTAAPLVMRWRLDADIARAIDALGEDRAKIVKTVTARTWCKLSEIVTERPNVTFAKAVEALNPKPPPTGTDSPSSARGDTATGDATPADAAPSAEAQASIARVGDPHAYLATKSTFTEIERAVVAHGAHVATLADAAVARLEALGEGGDDGNRARLVAAWVSESASRAQRAERTASQVRVAA